MNNSVDQSEHDDETIHIHGWCAAFCEDMDDNPQGGSTEHESFCRSSLRGSIEMKATNTSAPVKVWMTLIKPYVNGWINRQQYLREVGDADGLVQLEIQSYTGEFDIDVSQPTHPTLALKMTPGEARTMAAHLTWFADNADRLTEDLSARNRKRRGY